MLKFKCHYAFLSESSKITSFLSFPIISFKNLIEYLFNVSTVFFDFRANHFHQLASIIIMYFS